jgi:hypothetical protein
LIADKRTRGWGSEEEDGPSSCDSDALKCGQSTVHELERTKLETESNSVHSTGPAARIEVVCEDPRIEKPSRCEKVSGIVQATQPKLTKIWDGRVDQEGANAEGRTLYSPDGHWKWEI